MREQIHLTEDPLNYQFRHGNYVITKIEIPKNKKLKKNKKCCKVFYLNTLGELSDVFVDFYGNYDSVIHPWDVIPKLKP